MSHIVAECMKMAIGLCKTKQDMRELAEKNKAPMAFLEANNPECHADVKAFAATHWGKVSQAPNGKAA